VADGLVFRVHDAFVVTGRGTTVVGYIERGPVRDGDSLRLMRQGTQRIVRCEGVSPVRVANWQPGDPVLVGLLLPELAPDDVSTNDTLTHA
jgi:translation elongation factor EF-Tu-like GTPase